MCQHVQASVQAASKRTHTVHVPGELPGHVLCIPLLSWLPPGASREPIKAQEVEAMDTSRTAAVGDRAALLGRPHKMPNCASKEAKGIALYLWRPGIRVYRP